MLPLWNTTNWVGTQIMLWDEIAFNRCSNLNRVAGGCLTVLIDMYESNCEIMLLCNGLMQAITLFMLSETSL